METFPTEFKYSVFYKFRQRFGKLKAESWRSAQFLFMGFVHLFLLMTYQEGVYVVFLLRRFVKSSATLH